MAVRDGVQAWRRTAYALMRKLSSPEEGKCPSFTNVRGVTHPQYNKATLGLVPAEEVMRMAAPLWNLIDVLEAKIETGEWDDYFSEEQQFRANKKLRERLGALCGRLNCMINIALKKVQASKVVGAPQMPQAHSFTTAQSALNFVYRVGNPAHPSVTRQEWEDGLRVVDEKVDAACEYFLIMQNNIDHCTLTTNVFCKGRQCPCGICPKSNV